MATLAHWSNEEHLADCCLVYMIFNRFARKDNIIKCVNNYCRSPGNHDGLCTKFRVISLALFLLIVTSYNDTVSVRTKEDLAQELTLSYIQSLKLHISPAQIPKA